MTIEDIARIAGVSTATVSRVLNNKPDVKAKTREHVLEVLREHHFAPNLVAASLAGQRGRLIGILVPSLNWPFVSEIIHGVSDALEESAYEIVLYTVPRAQNRNTVIQRILSTRLTSGLLAIQVGQATAYLNDLSAQGFPVVMITDQILPVPAVCPVVDVDHQTGAYEVVTHLLRSGYRRIAHIQGDPSFHSTHLRYAGYCAALQEAGIALDPALVVQGDFTAPSGRACAQQLFALAQRPDAIFSANDEMCYGVLAVAEQLGLQIGKDVALAGFDDLPLSAHLYPALTTVRQPFQEMGRQAAHLLCSLIDAAQTVEKYSATAEQDEMPAPPHAPAPQPTSRLLLPTTLIVRDSCKPLQPVPLDSSVSPLSR